MKLHEFQRVCNRVKLSQRQSDRLFAWAQRAVLESEKKRERKNDFFIGTVVGIATIAVLLMALTIPMAWNMRKEGEVPLMSAAETLEGTEIGDVDNTNQTQVSYLTVSGESDVETCAEILSQMQDGSIVYLEDLQAILAQDPGILTQNGIVCAQPTDETLHQLFVYRKFGLNHALLLDGSAEEMNEAVSEFISEIDELFLTEMEKNEPAGIPDEYFASLTVETLWEDFESAVQEKPDMACGMRTTFLFALLDDVDPEYNYLTVRTLVTVYPSAGKQDATKYCSSELRVEEDAGMLFLSSMSNWDYELEKGEVIHHTRTSFLDELVWNGKSGVKLKVESSRQHQKMSYEHQDDLADLENETGEFQYYMYSEFQMAQAEQFLIRYENQMILGEEQEESNSLSYEDAWELTVPQRR